MVQVTIVSSSIIRPENINQSGRTKIHLTPHDLDLLYLVYPQRGLLFPKPDPETPIIPRLKASLSAALEIYFPFAGRLVRVNNLDNETTSFYVECDGSGAKFVHAKAESITVKDILRYNGYVPDFIAQLFPANNVESRDALISEPLLALQVTEMKDGVFISFGYNHMVADGSSFWSFFHTWSKICLNGSVLNIKPIILKDWFLNRIEFPVHIPVSELEKMPRSREISTTERVFHFSKKKISFLKAKANEEIGSVDLQISSLQVVIAYLWMSIIRHSGLNREEKTQCKVAANMRRRLDPPLEAECFGNVTDLAVATNTVGEMLDQLGWTALQINKTIRSQTNERYKTFAENWVRDVKIPKIGMGSRIADNSLIVASSPWFEVYDHDFGWGKPIAARAGPGNGIGGLLVMFRGLEEGSIDVHTTLTSSLWSDVLVNL